MASALITKASDALLPRGRANAMQAIAVKMFRDSMLSLIDGVRDFLNPIYGDLWGETMREDAILNYEKQYGLSPAPSDTLSQRAEMVEAAMGSMTGYCGPGYIQDRLQVAGFNVAVRENLPAIDLLAGTTIQFASADKLSNGDFSAGDTDWAFGSAGVGDSFAVVDGVGVFTIPAGSPGAETPLISQIMSTDITAGKTYTLSFDAWADSAQATLARLGNFNGADYDTVQTLVPANLTTSRQRFTGTLVATNSTSLRLIFGADTDENGGTVYVDNFSVVESGFAPEFADHASAPQFGEGYDGYIIGNGFLLETAGTEADPFVIPEAGGGATDTQFAEHASAPQFAEHASAPQFGAGYSDWVWIFIVEGLDGNLAEIPSQRRKALEREILRLKPAHLGVFMRVRYI